MKAIFLDRDDCIIVDKIDQYKPDEIEYFPDTFNALKMLRAKGYGLFLVTNQSGVARGLFSSIDVQMMHNRIEKDMMAHGLAPFDDILFCSASDNAHPWRKPNSGMVTTLIKKWGIDPKQSYMIGDKVRDAECGLGAGVESHLMLDKMRDERFRNFASLTEFAEYVK